MPRAFPSFPSLLTLSLALGGCATIAGRRQIIAVDSQPRGADVYVDGASAPAGKTPLFLEVTRSRSLSLDFRSGAFEHRLDDPCGIRWKGFGITNAVMTALMWPVGLGSIAIDLADGAAFECEGRVLEPLPELAKAPPAVCHRYLVVPPFHSDELASDRLAARWIRRQLPTLGPCDTVLPFEEGKTQLSFLNLDNTSDLAPGGLDRSQANLLGFETGATDLVFLRSTKDKDRVEVTPKLEDLQRGTVTEQPPLVLGGREAERLVETGGKKYLSYSINLLPNSVTYRLNRASYDVRSRDEREVSGVREVGTLPQYLTGFSLTDVEHPRGIGAWGVTFRVYPFVMPEYWELSYDLTAPGQPATGAKTRVIEVIAQYYASLTAHTPVGAFSLSAGAGPLYFNERRPHGPVNDRLVLSTSMDVTYTAFVTDRVYFQTSTSTTQFAGQPLPLEQATLAKWQETSVGFGYFIPALRGQLRQLLASRLDRDDEALAH